MRWRALHADIFDRPEFLLLPEFPRLLFFELLAISDSYGRACGHPAILAHRFGPTTRTPSEHADALRALEDAGLISWYAQPGTSGAWIEICGFDDDQPSKLLERRGAPKLPERTSDHVPGFSVHCQSHDCEPISGQVAHQSTPTRAPVALKEKERKKRERAEIDRVIDLWKESASRRREATKIERSRVAEAIRAFDEQTVGAFIRSELSDPWYWDPSGGAWRRDLTQILSTKPPRPWRLRISNFIEQQSEPEQSAPVYEPDDTADADRALRQAMEVTP